MKILFSTGGLFYLPLEEVFQLAGDAGFDGCDLVITPEFGNAGFLDVVFACSEILPILSIHAPYRKMPAWGTEAEVLVRTVELAKRVGARVVNFHPPSWYLLEINFYKWFQKVQDFQKAFGCDEVFLAVENMPLMGKRLMLAPYVLSDYKDMMEFGVERNLYFTFDTTHYATFGKDVVVAFLNYLKSGRLKNIHLSDFGDFRQHRFLGRGELPVVKLLNTVRRTGYDEMVTLEISPYELPRTREWLTKLMRHQAAFMKLHLGIEDCEQEKILSL